MPGKFNLLISVLLIGSFATNAHTNGKVDLMDLKQQTEEFRRRPPEPLALRPLSLPKPTETTLPNGLRIVVVEDKRLPLVSFRLSFRTGKANDPSGVAGLTDLTTSMLTEGTESRTSRQIADEVARLGASLSASTSSDFTTIAASSLSIYMDEILDLLADVTLRPTFPQSELDLLKKNTKEALKAQRAQASFLASERTAKVIYGQHPYSVIAPTTETIDAITREKMSQSYSSRFTPDAAVLVIVGDIKKDEIVGKVERLFKNWKRRESGKATFPAPPSRNSRTLYVVDRPGSAQSNIVISNVAINRTNPDYFSMVVLDTILGSTSSSRIFMNLREEKGYTYGAYTTLDARRETGAFNATAEVRGAVTGASLKEFFYELERIKSTPVTDEELKNAKSFLTGVFPIRLETQERLIAELVQIQMYGLPNDYLHTYRERIMAITKEDLLRVARKYILPETAAIVIVGDAASIMEQIKPYASKIEIFDSTGNPKQLPSSTPASNQKSTGLTGKWDLTISVPGGQKVPATLIIKQESGKLVGTVESKYGQSEINGTFQDERFNAELSFNLMGQSLAATVVGQTVGENIEGTINMKSLPPLSYTGSRSSN
jgi:zinc protease